MKASDSGRFPSPPRRDAQAQRGPTGAVQALYTHPEDQYGKRTSPKTVRAQPGGALQSLIYAVDRHSMLIHLPAMDAAGKGRRHFKGT